MGRRIVILVVLLELVSVIVWWKLAHFLPHDGPFGWAGPIYGLLWSGMGALFTLGVSAHRIWRQPAGGRAFWVLFTLMVGGTVGMALCIFYVNHFLLKD
jgi:hypothetical protein